MKLCLFLHLNCYSLQYEVEVWSLVQLFRKYPIVISVNMIPIMGHRPFGYP
jgi:hypothetical protein